MSRDAKESCHERSSDLIWKSLQLLQLRVERVGDKFVKFQLEMLAGDIDEMELIDTFHRYKLVGEINRVVGWSDYKY